MSEEVRSFKIDHINIKRSVWSSTGIAEVVLPVPLLAYNLIMNKFPRLKGVKRCWTLSNKEFSIFQEILVQNKFSLNFY